MSRFVLLILSMVIPMVASQGQESSQDVAMKQTLTTGNNNLRLSQPASENQGISIGINGKDTEDMSLSSNLYNNTSERWLHIYLNALCDPEMTLYTAKPKYTDYLYISKTPNSITLSSFAPAFNACVMSRHDNGNYYYEYLEDDRPNSKTFQVNDSVEYYICANSLGFIPYRAIYGNVVFLQNEKLSNNLNVIGKNSVIIGDDVDSGRTNGPVFVENGKTVIKAPNGVTITANFEVKPGAAFEINTN